MESEIFLTLQEARDAVALDLQHYGVQTESLEAMAELAGGSWPARFRALLKSAEPPPPDGLLALVREFLNSPTVAEETLCGALSLLFWADVRKAKGAHGEAGVSVATELQDFVCLQCGQCCTNLDYSRALTDDDVAMWQHAGRDDILAWVGKDSEDGGYVIWVNPDTGESEDRCPFLTFQNGRFLCAIHNDKPAICREYPATRKHGFMTGCTGVEVMLEKSKRMPPAARG